MGGWGVLFGPFFCVFLRASSLSHDFYCCTALLASFPTLVCVKLSWSACVVAVVKWGGWGMSLGLFFVSYLPLLPEFIIVNRYGEMHQCAAKSERDVINGVVEH